jgi:hypothetical protein
MPQVTRFALQGNFFKQDTEPNDWVDSDLWADTSQSPPVLNINNNGTALAIGSVEAAGSDTGKTPDATANNISSATIEFNHSTTFQTRCSASVTPTKGSNLIVLSGSAVIRGRGGSQTFTLEISEGGTEVVTAVTSTFNTNNDTSILLINGVLSDQSIASHTYDNRTKSSGANQVGLGDCGIFANLIE